MKRLNKNFFNTAVIVLSRAQSSGISVFGTLSDSALPDNTTRWFDATVVVPTIDAHSLGKLLTAVEAMEFDDGAIGAISSISISKERDQIRLSATVVRYAPMTSEQLHKLLGGSYRDYFNDWTGQ
jgi:hypothetical protein